MYICNCNGITEREIRGAIELGCDSIADLQRELGVASCCGKCLPDATRLLRACQGAGHGACPGSGLASPIRLAFGSD
jgi:bacterioferritin-associated ferredoxin